MNTVNLARGRILRVVICVILISAFPTPTFAWNDKAHRIIAALAWIKLKNDPAIQNKISELLGDKGSDGGPLIAISTWADAYTGNQDTTSWHFVAIPLSDSRYDENRHCPYRNCLVAKINEKKIELGSSRSRQTRIEALKYLVHLVGDVHQPLHCADNNDAGGNRVQVKFFGNLTTLHRVWDSDMIERAALSESQYVRKLEGIRTSPGYWVDRWAEDSHLLAVKYAYAIPKDRELGNAYYKTNLPIVDRQLAIAAEKLAQVLRDALSPPRR